MNFRMIFGAVPATKRDFSDKKRTDLAKEGKALPDGSFPIVNGEDLQNAIDSYGRAKDPKAAKDHIIARARELDMVDKLPADWKVKKEDQYELTVVIKEADDENPDPNRVFVMAEVYAPDIPDSDGEFMTAEEIKKAAYGFMRDGYQDQIDVMHDGHAVDGVCMVESFIARKDDPMFREGAWVAGVDVDNPELAQKIRKGELNGFSFEALVHKSPDRHVEMEIPDVGIGVTSKSEGHDHEITVRWGPEGQFLGGYTSPGPDGHTHVIKRGTATEVSRGHSHRFDATKGITVSAVDNR